MEAIDMEAMNYCIGFTFWIQKLHNLQPRSEVWIRSSRLMLNNVSLVIVIDNCQFLFNNVKMISLTPLTD